MLLKNLWLCGTAKNEAELKGEGQVVINPNSNFDNGHSCGLRNFPQFLPSSPKRAQQWKLHLPALLLSWHPQPPKKAAYAEENLLAAPSSLALFRGLCVGYGSVSLPHHAQSKICFDFFRFGQMNPFVLFITVHLCFASQCIFSHFLRMLFPSWLPLLSSWLIIIHLLTSLYFPSNFPTDNLSLPLLQEGDRACAEFNQWVFALSLCSDKVNFSPKLIQLFRMPVCCRIDMCS